MRYLKFLSLFISSLTFAQVGIGTVTPNGILEVSSALPLPSTQRAGFVPPTVALSANNSTATTTNGVNVINPNNNGIPQTGTIVYNSNTSTPGVNQVIPGYYFFNGTSWDRINSGNVNWLLSGNSNTNAATNYIGTNDLQDLAFRTNNTEKMRIDSNGRIGIGTVSLTSKVKIDAFADAFPSLEIVPRTTAPTGTASGQMAIINGSLFIYDLTRAKWLSSETMTYSFGLTGNADGDLLQYASVALAGSGARILKNATIVGITVQTAGGNATKVFDVTASISGTTSYTLVGGALVNSNVNVNVDAGEYIRVSASTAGTFASDPTVTLHLKWRE